MLKPQIDTRPRQDVHHLAADRGDLLGAGLAVVIKGIRNRAFQICDVAFQPLPRDPSIPQRPG